MIVFFFTSMLHLYKCYPSVSLSLSLRALIQTFALNLLCKHVAPSEMSSQHPEPFHKCIFIPVLYLLINPNHFETLHL